MSVVNERQFIEGKLRTYLRLSVAKNMGQDRVLFRDMDTGRFAFSTNIWSHFREHYEELKYQGAFG